MLEAKFLFVGKVLFIAFIFINLPNFLPVNLFDVSYFFLITTTIFDTSSLLVLSLAISKFIHIRNFRKVEDLNSLDNNDDVLIDQISFYRNKLNDDNKLAFILVISFAFFSLIQPIILILDINKNDMYSSSIVNSINLDFNDNKKEIDNLILNIKSESGDKEELRKLQDNLNSLKNLKENNIQQILENNNRAKFQNAKIIIRNFFLGALWLLCFYKIYKI